MPQRIQMTRSEPWRHKSPAAVIVARGAGRKWANPCRVGGAVDREYASAAYAKWLGGCKIARELYGEPPSISDLRAELSGKDLACWCDHKGHCHADALLHLANASTDQDAADLLQRWQVCGPYHPH